MATHPLYAVFSVVGFAILVIPIAARVALRLPLLVLGCLIPIATLFYVSVHYKSPDIHSSKYDIPRMYVDPFNVTGEEDWERECQQLIDNLDASVCNEIYPRNEEINDVLNSIVAFILRDFVQNWYRKITVDQTFIVDLKREFKFIISQLQLKLQSLDFAQLLVKHLAPIIDEHIVKFNKAMEITKTKVVKSKELEDSDIIVQNYANLHSAISLESDDQASDIKRHTAKLVDKILPQILNESDLHSSIIKIIMKEILGTLVLGSIAINFSDPDFFNQLIESQVTQLMNDRGDVKKLREFIKQSIANKNNKVDLVNDDFFHLFSLNLTLSGKQFERYTKSLSSTNNEVYLKRCLYYITWKTPRILQLATNEDSKAVGKFQKRTEELVNVIQSRLSYLATAGNRVSKPALSMYSSVLSSSSSVHLSQLGGRLQVPPLPSYTLQEILHSSKTLDYFTNWMNHRQDRNILLNYYISVNSLRNPLEYIDMEVASRTCQTSKIEEHQQAFPQSLSALSDETTKDDTLTEGGKMKPHKYEHTHRSPDLTSSLIFRDDDLSQADDICSLYETYFDASVLHISSSIASTVHNFIVLYASKTADSSVVSKSYLEARKAILRLQVSTYSRMKQSDFRAFEESDLWIRMCATVVVPNPSNDAESGISASTTGREYSTNGDPLSAYNNQDDDHYLDVNMTGKVSDKVVQAVESALTEIMKDSKDFGNDEDQYSTDTCEADITINTSSKDNLLFGNKRASRLVSDDVADDLFGATRDESIFGEDEHCTDSLFNDNVVATGSGKGKNNEGDTNWDEVDKSVGEISVSGSRRLSRLVSFADRINKLNDEVDKLNKQKDVIEALLKKAEIINNVPETKLLTRSKMSLEREITLKELKREQYLFQDAENSLYDKSAITITTFITERDNHGTEFTSYIIKITRYNDKLKNSISDEWIVKRRFSEFYELQSYLKTKYDCLSNIEFPKRKMVMTFRQDGIVERRLVTLKAYLQELIKNEGICQDAVFKTFLSNETFDIENIKQHIRQLKKDGSRFSALEGGDDNTSEIITFIQPITDLVLDLFQLNGDSNKWIKGKTVVMIFQQVFGSAIEKFIRSSIESKLNNENSVLDIFQKIKSALWPQNQWRKRKPVRTALEKEKSKEHARVLLHLFVTDTCAKVMGSESSMLASETIWSVLQNETLNRHLMLTLLDEIFGVLFA